MNLQTCYRLEVRTFGCYHYEWKSEHLPVVGDLAQIADAVTSCDLNDQFCCKSDGCSEVLGMVVLVQEVQERVVPSRCVSGGGWAGCERRYVG